MVDDVVGAATSSPRPTNTRPLSATSGCVTRLRRSDGFSAFRVLTASFLSRSRPLHRYRARPRGRLLLMSSRRLATVNEPIDPAGQFRAAPFRAGRSSLLVRPGLADLA
jgi:hypothetical protein